MIVHRVPIGSAACAGGAKTSPDSGRSAPATIPISQVMPRLTDTFLVMRCSPYAARSASLMAVPAAEEAWCAAVSDVRQRRGGGLGAATRHPDRRKR